MKKQFKILIVLLLACFPLIGKAVSTDAYLKLECDSSTYNEKQEDVTCNVKLAGVTTEVVKSVSFKLDVANLGDAIEYASADDDYAVVESDGTVVVTPVEGVDSISNGVLVTVSGIKMPTTDVATYKDGQYKFNMKFTNQSLTMKDPSDDSKLATANIVLNEQTEYSVRLKSTDATLSSLSINNAGVEGFMPKAFKYKVTKDASEIKITAIANNKNATIEIEGDEFTNQAKNYSTDLLFGINIIDIEVTSESGTTKTYELMIYRPFYIFIGYDLKYNFDKNSYTLDVDPSVDKVAICRYDNRESFKLIDNVLCLDFNTTIADSTDVGFNPEIFANSALLNGESILSKYATMTDTEFFENSSYAYDEEGNESEYIIIGSLKNGSNNLSFKINNNLATYNFVINRGEATSNGQGSGEGTGDDVPGSFIDDIVENPKTAVAVSVGGVLVLGLAGYGVYYYLKKKNKFHQI